MDYQVIWRGIAHDASGYANVTRKYVLALDQAGVDVRLEAINYEGTGAIELPSDMIQNLNRLAMKPLAQDKKKILIVNLQPFQINIEEDRKKYDYIICNACWETTIIPEEWFPNVELVDAMMVPCVQTYDAIRDSGCSVPVYVVSYGADTDEFNPDNAPFYVDDTKDKFTFLSIFQWQNRKAPEKLLQAYWNEFSSKDNVGLVVKTYINDSKQSQREILDVIQRFKNLVGKNDTAPVYITVSPMQHQLIRGLYAAADVFVLPSRGEGFGFPFVEALSSGIPTIAPLWGARADYLNLANSFLVDYSMFPVTGYERVLAHEMTRLFQEGMEWCEPDVASLQYQMRYAYEHQEEVKEKGNQGRMDMLKMNWSKTAEETKASIELMLKGRYDL